MQITLERQSKTIALSFNTDNSIAYEELYLAVQDKMSGIVNGGKFLAGVVGKAFTIVGNAVSVLFKSIYVQAAAGGLGSKLAGGSFELGFLTAGLAFAVNQVVTQLAQKGRHINPQSGGADGPRITFNNDVPSGASTDLPVDPDLATAIEDSVVGTGLNVNINSTTGGHSSGSHVQGRAADINRINGLRVDNPLNVDNVRTLQEALINHSNTNQVLGPVLNVNKWHNAPQPSPSLINNHRNHIHINVPR